MEGKKITIGFITYGNLTSRYLPYFLDSLKKQTFQDFKIIVIDNSEQESNDNVRYVAKNYPEIQFNWAGNNLGFAQAYNLIINQAVASGSEYFFMVNPDMILEPDCLAKLVDALENNKYLSAVAPKVLRWDFANLKKTKQIDTCGIVRHSGLRFVDLGQGQIDKGQFDLLPILGPSGCAGLFRISALEDIKIDHKYFDEIFFMYKEDIDLVYRLNLAGYKSELIPLAIVHHDRTATAVGKSDFSTILNRRNKSQQVKIWSFWGQQILFYKYWYLQNLWQKINILYYQFKMLFFAFLFERYLLDEFKRIKTVKSKIKAKQALIKIKK